MGDRRSNIIQIIAVTEEKNLTNRTSGLKQYKMFQEKYYSCSMTKPDLIKLLNLQDKRQIIGWEASGSS